VEVAEFASLAHFYLWVNDPVSQGFIRLDSGFSLLGIVTIIALTRGYLRGPFRASSKILSKKHE